MRLRIKEIPCRSNISHPCLIRLIIQVLCSCLNRCKQLHLTMQHILLINTIREKVCLNRVNNRKMMICSFLSRKMLLIHLREQTNRSTQSLWKVMKMKLKVTSLLASKMQEYILLQLGCFIKSLHHISSENLHSINKMKTMIIIMTSNNKSSRYQHKHKTFTTMVNVQLHLITKTYHKDTGF